MRKPIHPRDSVYWRTPTAPRAPHAASDALPPGDFTVERADLAIRHVHLLFWGSAWEGIASQRDLIAEAFWAALADRTTHADPRREPIPLVTTGVISAATHTSPGDPPDLLANADVSALVANLMSKRALSPWAGNGVALYCVVLCPRETQVDGRERYAYTSYRQNMRDVHCGWLICQDDAEMVAECVRKLLAEVESALLADAV